MTQSGDGVASKPNGERVRVEQQVVEIVSDSGEGAQKAGQSLGAIAAKAGNGVWTVEIIPAEIKPPGRSPAGASGIRVRMGSRAMTNMGDGADLVVAFNEQVLYGRIGQKAFKKGTILLLENKWATDQIDEIRQQYAEGVKTLKDLGVNVVELPLDEVCKQYTDNPRLGKNMFVLGMLCQIYGFALELAEAEIHYLFDRKGSKVVDKNVELLHGGHKFAAERVPYRYEIPRWDNDEPLVVMNGNQAVGLGVMASGMEVLSMYPITPATSVSHHVATAYHEVGGFLHQAEDEIAAIGFAIGATYAGKTACTVTSGPGMALKTEFIGTAVMTEIPLVIVVVQRGGPSTGLPTKVEQGDLLASLYGQPGDSPKIIMAAATIEECFHFVITARKLAEAFRMPVFVLTDANLATGVSPFPRPQIKAEWFPPPIDQSAWNKEISPYNWDPVTGLSPRPIPGQAGGEYVLTGLAHDEESHIAYEPAANQLGMQMRSAKLAAVQRTLKTPEVHGDPEGDLLVVAWGSTLGAIEEAVDRARADGHKVSSMHLHFVSPLPMGLTEIFSRFKQVMTVEINYSDAPDAPALKEGGTRRLAQLAWVLRAETLLPIDCWSNVYGQPIPPGQIYDELKRRFAAGITTATSTSAAKSAPAPARA